MSESSEYAAIRVRDSSGVSVSVNVLLQESIGGLRVKIAEAFDFLEDFDILLGYPPSVCKLPHDTPIMGNISPNDCIRILRCERSDTVKNSKATSSSPKSSIPAISSRSNSSNNRAVGFGARIMTFTGAIVPPSPAVGRNKKRAANFITTTAVSKKQKKVIGKKEATSGDGLEDICGALMTAADGGAGGCSKALRSVFRKAVAHQYNDSLAVARLRAAFAGRFSFDENLSIRVLGSGLSTEMNVSFPLRPECARSKVHVETVDLISVEMLRAILLSALEDDDGAGAAREFLKPVNMSKASPRIFWSLIKAFGPDMSSAMSQLFPQVIDWSWLSDRKRGFSERALVNKQQIKEAAEVIAKKKIARDLKKKKINGQSADASIEEVPLSDCSVATKIDSTSTTSASTNLKIMRGMDDPSVMSALMDPELVIESLVPKCFLEGLKLYLGGNAMHLLADMDFETPDCIRDVNKSILSCISSSSSSTVTTPTTLSSSSSTSQLVSTDALEMWVASAQITLVVAVMKALLGGCGRLQRALSSLGQRTPENLRVWNSTPESLYKRLLEYDPGLSSIYLSRLREGVCLREMFSLDWVRWMCTVCEDMRSSQSMLWLIHYTVDADEEESNEGDENGEEEVVVDDNENLWLSVPDDSNHIGSTVRCYPLSDDYWDEGEVIGYLPPDEEEPLPLWKVTGIRRSMITSSASGSNVKSSKSTNDSKIWTLDLEKEELIDALALYSALT